MKKTIIPVFYFILFTLFSFRTVAQHDKAEDNFFKTVFNCVKSADSSRFKQLFPDNLKFTEIMRLIVKKPDMPVYDKEDYEKDLLSGETRRFAKLIKNAGDLSINWNDAVFESYTISKTEKVTDELEDISGAILFSSNNIKYKMPFRNCMKYQGAFYGVSMRKIYKLVDGKYTDASGNEEPVIQ